MTHSAAFLLQDHHENPIGLASTIAHEMGHNFGLSHDDAGCVCGPSYSGNCVMADKLRLGLQTLGFCVVSLEVFTVYCPTSQSERH